MRGVITIKKKLIMVILMVFVLCACTNDKETTTSKDQPVTLTLSVAASLEDAMKEIQQAFEKEHSTIDLRFNFGGSGALQQQISQGAPVDLFFAAAEEPFQKLVKEGMINEEDHVTLVGNSLVLVTSKLSTISVQTLEDLKKDDIEKVALGTPESVPAGQYAKQTFEAAGLWDDLSDKFVFGKDVRQVLTYVETGNVEAGLVYKTDAVLSDQVNIAMIVDEKMHLPIVYPVGIIKDTKFKEEAKVLFTYLQSEEALTILEKYGFTKR